MPRYRYEGIKEPVSAGWWWCIPDPKSDFSGYVDGIVVEILEDDGEVDGTIAPALVGRLYGEFGAGDRFGFTGEYPTDIFGKWYGPIPYPTRKRRKRPVENRSEGQKSSKVLSFRRSH